VIILGLGNRATGNNITIEGLTLTNNTFAIALAFFSQWHSQPISDARTQSTSLNRLSTQNAWANIQNFNNIIMYSKLHLFLQLN